ncbi:pilus assembly protein [Phytoactinopolyspora mesophila]|uniref:Pilus assembly protein n=1 Tax=Phytoactinopolyspora mesophila TaxID=2650750 RepID=A0A7K3M6E3_9ACTN|nr:pilus assembly protein [Phytoactinopolyspora mesophila]NDL58607.1 pilus assembly protein [Phytoactinopolyspora mesophila]
MSRVRDERGGAIVEFHLLGLLLLVPVVYILLTVLDVQRSSYGVTQAAREAGRLYVTTGDQHAARLAAEVALRDQGLDADAVSVVFSCSATPCYQPGAEITVVVDTDVALPLVPDVLAGSAHAHVPVSATHVAVVDRYRALQ